MGQDRRELLQRLYRAAIQAVNGRDAVRRYLEAHPPHGDVHILAVGKAASAMLQGAADALGERRGPGLLITKYGHVDEAVRSWSDLDIVEAAHPVPDAQSLEAGEAAVAFLRRAPKDARFLILVSGGASALMERLPEGATAEDLIALNEYLLAAGLPIADINAVRKAVSTLKGGRLAHWIDGRPAEVLMISDVAGDDPATIGSGPFHPPMSALALPGLPDHLRHLADSAPPVPDASAFQSIRHHVVASNELALQAVRQAAEAEDLPVYPQGDLNDDVFVVADRVARAVSMGEPGLYLWGGEPTVVLPPDPGMGGRMQTLALAAALMLDGLRDIYLLAGSTDGSDGPNDYAGALVDCHTIARGRAEGCDAEAMLERADAGGFLQASGDLIKTGPTGSNVNDLVLALNDGYRHQVTD